MGGILRVFDVAFMRRERRNMAMIYFLCGLPSSGKTTLAKRLETEKEAARLTLDERMIAKSYHLMS